MNEWKITIVARSKLGGEYVTRDADRVLRHHWMYRVGDPREIGPRELDVALASGNLFPDGTAVANWAEVGEYIADHVVTMPARFTDLPPSPALARAALPTLRELYGDERTRSSVAPSVAHLLRSPGVRADAGLSAELLKILDGPMQTTARATRLPLPTQEPTRLSRVLEYFFAPPELVAA